MTNIEIGLLVMILLLASACTRMFIRIERLEKMMKIRKNEKAQ